MGNTDYEISKEAYEAAVFDLDGVITQTAEIHAAAWKKLFDEYLKARAERKGRSFTPFDTHDEYRRYVDGKPRYDGVQSFLESRGVRLPRGTPDDDPDQETICGLGNRKNRIFQTCLQEQGVSAYEDARHLIDELKSNGWKLAVISASKNCAQVLQAANASEWFDVMVDGVVSEKIGLAGKPEPDIFLEAVQRLGVNPRRAVVFEDAQAGVEAGKKGGFGRVIGVDRDHNTAALKNRGADIVVSRLSEIRLSGKSSIRKTPMDKLPSALAEIRNLIDLMDERQPVLFLDYDGTLTPIVNDPEQAFLNSHMKSALRRVSERWITAIVSGRDLTVLKNFVQLESLYYAGSHGFDISGPPGREIDMRKGDEFLPALDLAQKRLEKQLAGVSGATVERKKYSIAVHYRNVPEANLDAVETAVKQTRAEFGELRLSEGKKVYEIQPDIPWNKGKAVLWLMEALEIDGAEYFPLYLGDDITDEDAFEAIKDQGAGIAVKGGGHHTSAEYTLENTGETAAFLEELIITHESRKESA